LGFNCARSGGPTTGTNEQSRKKLSTWAKKERMENEVAHPLVPTRETPGKKEASLPEGRAEREQWGKMATPN